MSQTISTAAVIGAGVMGSAIAAHFAGAGVRVHLLDIVPPNLTDAEKKQPAARNKFAMGGLEKALKAKPAAFYDADAARLITPGNLEDHLERLRECDLVIEAVLEDLQVKLKLFQTIAPYLNDQAILASNTSGLSIAAMSATLPPALQQRFVVMHFFNPVRYMRLLEVLPCQNTSPAVLERAARFGEDLGKGVVYAKDTTNFIANRIGVYSLMLTMKLMEQLGLSIEQVDKIVGKAIGRPKSAAYQTGDLVGIDTLIHVAKNCLDSLPNDEEREIFRMPSWVNELAAAGQLGRKSGAGFYKKVGSEIMVWDLATKQYRAQAKVRFDSLGITKNIDDPGKRIKAMIAAPDPAGQLAWQVTARTLCYAATRMGEIADDVVNIDRAMRWGFNWDLGPFEVWDAIGVSESVARMEKEGIQVPTWVSEMLKSGQQSFYGGTLAAPTFYDVPKKKIATVPLDGRNLRLAALKADPRNVVAHNAGATLVDLGDGILCIEKHTKMNTLDADVISMFGTAVEQAEKNFLGLVIGNDGEHFCAGANLMMILMGAQQKQWGQIETVIRNLQNALQTVRYAKVPVVAAPFNYTLGGGAEVAMAAAACQAHAEAYMGLVEVGVGLIPAGCGCLRMVERFTTEASQVDGADLLPFIGQASLNVALAKVSTSAEEARTLRYLRPTDGISLNRDWLLYHAKARALGMANAGYRPQRPLILKAAGQDAAATISARVWGMREGGFASEHDALIANKIAQVLCGGLVAPGTELSEK
ncbi:MAG TPA: 3-hydroxyacyl-CoA dehydrogenase NAD-binding domain-containing protein, partial [Polyangiaceae bacterium]|nr:3-hydroxyacyl-CoA dehydrogenase NAD-binding domain-containing protein [Polyangiaceae bacterium]